jgi:hypothetical protein
VTGGFEGSSAVKSVVRLVIPSCSANDAFPSRSGFWVLNTPREPFGPRLLIDYCTRTFPTASFLFPSYADD